MDGTDSPIWFAGDLDDPWVAAIAETLPRQARRVDCPADLPDAWPSDGPSPSVVVVHRSTLTTTDALRLTRLRNRPGPTPKVILCHGPHARHAELERWARLIDVAIPEATARETLARHALGTGREARPGRRVAVVSTNHELRVVLADACRSGGHAPEPARDWLDTPPGIVAVWDVPVLEPDWPGRLALRAATSPVIALLGFADREIVRTAREHGASACLELPFEVEDLLVALDRTSTVARVEVAHVVPPPPMAKIFTAKTPRTRGHSSGG